MRYTNKYNLPQTFLNVLARDTYTRGAARISVTGLIDSPQQRILRERHDQEIEADVSEMIWAIMGKAIHKVLEDGADTEHIPEERLFARVLGMLISGQIDVQIYERKEKDSASVGLTDWKSTSAWAVMSDKVEWERQLNIYAFLLEVNRDYIVKDLKIGAIIRDWDRKEAARRPEYPQAPLWMVPIKLWSFEDREKYVRERVRLHQDAMLAAELGEDMPPCTDEERWMREPKFIAIKPGNQRATKVFGNKEDAAAFVKLKGGGLVVEERPARPTRCLEFCQAAPWCKQHHKWMEENKNDE